MARLGRHPLVLACTGALAFGLLLLAGCGHKEESTPVACLEGSKSYLKALEAAPGEVTLADGSTLGDCLPENQDAGDLSQVGEAMVEAATTLNAEAREAGGAGAATELGYLIGAVEKRSGETDGVHANLLRRLAVAARFAPGTEPLDAGFKKAYQQGFDAGAAGS